MRSKSPFYCILAASIALGGCVKSSSKRKLADSLPSDQTVTIDFNDFSLQSSRKNQLICKDFYQWLDSAHSYIGLNASAFQKSLQELQSLSVGTDFQPLAREYVKAARLCQDYKLKPSKYRTEESSKDQKTNTLKIAPEVSLTQAGPVTTIKTAVPVISRSNTKKSEKIIEAIEYHQDLRISPEDLVVVQRLEDWAYEESILLLKKNGFHRFSEKDFIGTWSWKWENEGRIEFTLKNGGDMEAELFPAKQNLKYKLIDEGKGSWTMKQGRLSIKMTHVDIHFKWQDFPVPWIEAEKIEFVNAEKILLGNGQELTKIDKEEED